MYDDGEFEHVWDATFHHPQGDTAIHEASGKTINEAFEDHIGGGRPKDLMEFIGKPRCGLDYSRCFSPGKKDYENLFEISSCECRRSAEEDFFEILHAYQDAGWIVEGSTGYHVMSFEYEVGSTFPVRSEHNDDEDEGSEAA